MNLRLILAQKLLFLINMIKKSSKINKMTHKKKNTLNTTKLKSQQCTTLNRKKELKVELRKVITKSTE